MSATGVLLAVDPGDVRIGVAASDSDRVLAVPVETVRAGTGDVERIRTLAQERAAVAIVVGLPVTLAGREGAAAERARAFAVRLVAVVTVPVHLVDERLTTVSASQQLRAGGRGSSRSRSVIDQAAAVVLLQGVLDQARRSGAVPGEPVVGQTAEEVAER